MGGRGGGRGGEWWGESVGDRALIEGKREEDYRLEKKINVVTKHVERSQQQRQKGKSVSTK